MKRFLKMGLIGLILVAGSSVLSSTAFAMDQEYYTTVMNCGSQNSPDGNPLNSDQMATNLCIFINYWVPLILW